MKDNVIPRVSKSSLSDFNFCQQQYFIKRILGVREPPSDDMTRGSNVHDAVDAFYQDVSVSYAASMKSYGYDHVLKYFKEFIPDSNPKRGIHELGEEKHLRKYMTVEAERFMECADPHFFLPIGNEVALDALVTIDGQLVHLTGIVDRLFADKDGIPHIHELKTGMWKDHKPKKWQSMREEMAFYVYLLKESNIGKHHKTLGGLECERWGWDHTGGYMSKTEETTDVMFRGAEAVRSQEMASMLDSLKLLINTHRKYKGDQDGKHFGLVDFWNVEEYICNPWCRVKGFCPRFGKSLWPYGDEE